MNKNFEDFQAKFKTNELKIYENANWIWSLRPLQCTVGSGILSMKHYAEKLSDISLDGGRDFSEIIKTIESTLSHTFSYNKINYLMLMMVDKHVHFHVVPRYEKDIEFAGLKWVDKGWPKLPVLDAEEVPLEVLSKIIKTIKGNLP